MGGEDDGPGGGVALESASAVLHTQREQPHPPHPSGPPAAATASAARAGRRRPSSSGGGLRYDKAEEEVEAAEDEAPQPPPYSASSAAAAFQNRLAWRIESCSVGRGRKRKAILRDIVGESRGGELTAIMGASGAGKTTLLECVSLRSREFRGAVHLNGRPARPTYFTQSALVYQQEVMCEFLSVEEHLLFQGTARMSDRYSPQEIAKRVDQVIAEMGLGKCRHTLVGGPNAKGLSGGERKRLGIATELLLCPAILFLDEPTTSVDSVMAEAIVALLRRLAGSRGLMVLATIHSPSSQLFAYFSHLLLLTADGRLAFHGAVPDALAHFAALGLPLPEAYNPADHFIKLVVRTPPKDPQAGVGGHGGGHRRRRQACEAERVKEKDSNDALVAAFRASPYWCGGAPSYRGVDAHRRLRGVQGQHASSLALFRLNLWRSSLQTARNALGFYLYGAVMAIVGLCFGVLYFQQGDSNWRNFVGLLYALTVALLYMCPLTVILRTPLDWPMLLREYFAGANAAGPYLAAKALSELPFAYGPMLLATILYWMTGLEASLGQFLKFGGVVVLATQASCALALMVASFSANALLTLALLPAFITPMVLFSGFLYDTAALPPYLAWLPKVSIVNYGFSAMVTLQQGLLPPDVRPAVLRFTNVDPDALGQSVLVLLAMTVAFYAVAYASLALRLRAAKRA